MNDFINAQINAIIMTSVTVKKSLIKNLSTLLLMLKYFKNFVQITHYFNILQKSTLMTLSVFQKFKINALYFIVHN